MKFDEVAILLSCHSFEDFPVFHRGEDADSLLASWTAMWHPQVIDNCRRIPNWYRIDEPPTDDLARILIRPTTESEQSLGTLSDDLSKTGGLLVENRVSRPELVQQILSSSGGARPVDSELAADFMALGYAYLQTELLTRQMHYSTRMADTAFADNLVAAAEKAMSADVAGSRRLLESCFDLLSQERNHYYAVDVFLVDFSLVTDSLLGAPLLRQLNSATKSNLLLEARLLERIEQQEPESWKRLRSAIDEQHVGLVGGEYAEYPLTLLSAETIRQQLESGLREFEQRLGCRPHVFGRRRFGLVPTLPQMLLRFDFQGALHATFDGGRFPEATQAKSRWEGEGQFSIDAITRAPLDATQSETFLKLATSLSESMDMDHIATRCFAHWVGDASPWYDELRRVAKFTQSLGRFVTVDEYFQDTYDPGIHDRFKADQYHSPWLRQQGTASATRPLSTWVVYWRHYWRLQSWLNCSLLWLMVEDCPESRRQTERAEACLAQFGCDPLNDRWEHELYDASQQLNRAASGLAEAVAGNSTTTAATTAAAAATATTTAAATATATDDAIGFSLVNPLSFPRRIGLFDSPTLPDVQPPVYAAESCSEGPRVVADVPAMGISNIVPAGAKTRKTAKLPPPLAVENVLRNEFLEARFDPNTGSLTTLRDYRDRTNRLSMQLACRTPGSSEAGRIPPAQYSSMVGESLEILQADSIVGKLRTRGRLTDDQGETMAEFVQTFELWRGSRVVEVCIDLQPHVVPGDDLWDSYLACRFAWSSEAANLARGINETKLTTNAKRFEAPLFFQIDDGSGVTTVLTGGLPFHRRVGRRMLDTLLIAGGEQQRQFHLGIGLDLKQPFREAIAFLSPDVIVPGTRGSGQSSSMWLFHVDARHVLCTLRQPVWHDDRLAGLRLRLVELEGRGGCVKLQSFRSMSSARKVDGFGQTVEVCEVDGPQLAVNVSPYEQVEIETLFVDQAAPDAPK